MTENERTAEGRDQRCRSFCGDIPISAALTAAALFPARLHRDERGTISILTLTTIIGLMMLMGMVINVGRHIDDKVKMQNAVDAAAYSGGTVLARGMNSIAFTNHLLCDVFALTAFLREGGRDRNAESLTAEILQAWSVIAEIFKQSEFQKFAKLGPAMAQKVPLEKDLVRSYSDMTTAISELVLPVLEYVLEERLIPEFQRAVVQNMPQLAQQTTNEVARRHGQKQPNRPQIALLWRTYAMQPVGYPDELDPLTRTLPAVDPTPPDTAGGGSLGATSKSFPVRDPHPDPLEGVDYRCVQNPQQYLDLAMRQRDQLSKRYLKAWIDDRLQFFDTEGKMSQFSYLFRVFSGVTGRFRDPCGQLGQLLYIEYPASNLPHVLRFTDEQILPDNLRKLSPQGSERINRYLDQNFMFLGIAYRKKFIESFNGLFKNPLSSDPLTFSQISLFIPQPRLWNPQNPAIGAGIGSGQGSTSPGGGGGALMGDVSVPSSGSASGSASVPSAPGFWPSDPWPMHWDLLNQNWTVQLVPATTENLAALLQSNPPAGALKSSQPVNVQVPRLGGVSSSTIRKINGH